MQTNISNVLQKFTDTFRSEQRQQKTANVTSRILGVPLLQQPVLPNRKSPDSEFVKINTGGVDESQLANAVNVNLATVPFFMPRINKNANIRVTPVQASGLSRNSPQRKHPTRTADAAA